MSFEGPQETTIKYGDFGIAYINPSNLKCFQLKKGEAYLNRHGRFNHDQMVGKKWGSKIASSNNQGFIFMLHPTPELWTIVLSHRTQILYQPDISFITCMLDLKPGTNMIEAGTGSGSFSHSIARTVAPSGKLYTFEYHKERQMQAQEEFSSHNLENVVSEHRDVCKDGFDPTRHQDLVTAIFLDLPSPWECIAHPSFLGTFQKDRIGRICCFSPCIEQVQLTCKALKEAGFVEIRMFEVLMRDHVLQKTMVESLPTTKQDTLKKRKRANGQDSTEPSSVLLSSCIVDKVKGHTSFLTFATFIPKIN